MTYARAIITMATLTTCVIGRQNNDNHFVGQICWTCYNKSDNKHCNDWAPNLSCPPGHSVCKTVHRLSVTTGNSLAVNKHCVEPHQCTMQHVGCRSIFYLVDTFECTSCCDFPFCNEQVPTNDTEAFLLSAITASATCRTAALLLRDVITICCVVIVTVIAPLRLTT